MFAEALAARPAVRHSSVTMAAQMEQINLTVAARRVMISPTLERKRVGPPSVRKAGCGWAGLANVVV